MQLTKVGNYRASWGIVSPGLWLQVPVVELHTQFALEVRNNAAVEREQTGIGMEAIGACLNDIRMAKGPHTHTVLLQLLQQGRAAVNELRNRKTRASSHWRQTLLEELSENSVIAADDITHFNLSETTRARAKKTNNLSDESANAMRSGVNIKERMVHLSLSPIAGRRSKKESTTAVTEREKRTTGALLPLIAL